MTFSVDPEVCVLQQNDLTQFADIRLPAFRFSDHTSVTAMSAYLREMFLENPWNRGHVSSLAAKLPDGRIVGILGAVLRPFLFRGTPLSGLLLSHFRVYRGRGKVIGKRLLGSCLDGGGEFSWLDVANDWSISRPQTFCHQKYGVRRVPPVPQWPEAE